MTDLIPKFKVISANDPAGEIVDKLAAIKGLKKPEAARQLIEAGWKALMIDKPEALEAAGK